MKYETIAKHRPQMDEISERMEIQALIRYTHTHTLTAKYWPRGLTHNTGENSH